MARKSTGGANWGLIAALGAIAVAILGVVLFLGRCYILDCSAIPGNEKLFATCLPAEVEGVRANSSVVPRNPGAVDVYLDASGGMAGYAAAQPNIIGNLATLSRTFTQSSLYDAGERGKVTFRRFGNYRFDSVEPEAPALIEDPAVFARPQAYNEEVTNIDDLLKWVVHERASGEAPLSVIVTDLMLDNPEAVDQFEASVGGALRTMIIEDKLALGIMAVRVPFQGNIYVGSSTIPVDLQDRPLVIMMLGDPYQVRSYYEYLSTSEIAPFSVDTPVSNRAFALFGLEAGSIVLGEPESMGLARAFSRLPSRTRIPGADGIRSVRYDHSEAVPGDDVGMVLRVQANAGVEDYEVIGNEPIYAARLWKLDERRFPDGCADGTSWIDMGGLPSSGWKVSDQEVTYRLTSDIMEQAGLDDDGLYLVHLIAGQQGVVENHPAADWMREWSMDNGEITQRLSRAGNAKRIGVPGLEPLRRILLTELTMPERSKIERSASHLIIETQ